MNVTDLIARADWWTSDQHYGHARISELAGRPYGSVEEMNRDLIARHNACVRPDQIAVLCGDFNLGSFLDSIQVARELNGTLVLVPGNHDRISTAYRGSETKKAEWLQAYRDVGFTIAPESLTVTLAVSGLNVAISHFPYQGDSHGEDRHADLRPVDNGLPLIHGHVHEKWAVRRSEASDANPQGGSVMVNVGVDAPGLDFSPVSTARVVELLTAA